MADAEELYGCYGVVVPERKFHISPLCPCIRTIAGSKRAEITSYIREADAVIMGHTNRCPVCYNMYRFRIRAGDKIQDVLVDKYDLDVLLSMAKLYKDGHTITVEGMCSLAGMGYGETNDTMKRLRRLGLVASSEWMSNKQLRGKRKFTPLGRGVILAYEANVFGAPLDHPNENQPLEINTRLI